MQGEEQLRVSASLQTTNFAFLLSNSFDGRSGSACLQRANGFEHTAVRDLRRIYSESAYPAPAHAPPQFLSPPWTPRTVTEDPTVGNSGFSSRHSVAALFSPVLTSSVFLSPSPPRLLNFLSRPQLAPRCLPSPMISTRDQHHLHGSHRPIPSLPLPFFLLSVA
jgi:hypothetical protein